MKNYVRVLVVCVAAALLGLSSVSAYAQGAIGMVDVKETFDKYKVTKQHNEELEKMVTNYRIEMEVRAANRLLTEAELSELVKLKTKASPTDADKKRIDELEQRSKKLDEEFQNLKNKSDASDQDKARMKTLQEILSKNDTSGRLLAEEYSSQTEKRRNELSDQITNAIRQAITKVAQAKGIATVVDKVVVLYGGVDLTEEVIKTLNAN